MARTEKVWHPLFIDYMEMIINSPIYKGLAISRKSDNTPIWLAPKQTENGKQRIKWAKEKATQLGIKDEPGMYAKVMLEVHPTKKKVCQTCGKTMSLYYLYPSVSLVNSLKKSFDYETDQITSVFDIVDDLLLLYDENLVKRFFIKRFELPWSVLEKDLSQILWQCEIKTRSGASKLLGPGAMSNFPDRFDGFHSYNRCCRSLEDKGRSSENLRSYTKDRRAYEYWSDGNIHAANQYMGSPFFTGSSADHIGPISLGFIHDSLFLRRMPSGENSSKRDRLLYNDIIEIIAIETRHSISAMTWYSSLIWKHIKDNFVNNVDKVEDYRSALKVNMNSFMYILWFLLAKCGENAEKFLINEILSTKFDYFKYDYEFGPEGLITKQQLRNITDATKKEVGRFIRVAIQSVYEYNEKENRNTKSAFSQFELKLLNEIADALNGQNVDNKSTKIEVTKLVETIQNRIISQL